MAEKTRKRNQTLKGKTGNMMLVLTEDVAHLGTQGQLVEVKAGYARNYLLPNGMATVPTPHNLKLLERFKIKVHQAREARIADLKALSEQIQRVPHLTIEAHANEEGHLYGSVGPQEISKALYGKNLKVDPEMVRLEGLIKECALYEVDLHLGNDINTKVKVMVVPHKEDKK
jgi:large subunit ribosomal protein L9